MALLSKRNETIVLILAGLATGYAGYKVYIAGQSVKEVVTKDLNPVNKENVVNRQVDRFTRWATDGQYSSAGSWLFCKLNPEAALCPVGEKKMQTANELNTMFDSEQNNMLFNQERVFYEEDVL